MEKEINGGVYENMEREGMKNETRIPFSNPQLKSFSYRLIFIE